MNDGWGMAIAVRGTDPEFSQIDIMLWVVPRFQVSRYVKNKAEVQWLWLRLCQYSVFGDDSDRNWGSFVI